jgi:serine/threonine protein kinase
MSTILERLNRALAPEFQVEGEVASGGMGIVFLARDTALDRQVAIKVIRPEQATARATEKFLREARILANLRHPNVVPVHKAGEADGLFYYVMDFISEGTLAERLTRGPLSPADALKLGRDLLDALEPVHDQGVVHRDIKPSNIFLIGNRAVLTDFGIARPSRDPSDITETEPAARGTIGYMPPEQAYGQAVTNRTDLYAVAMVLYEAYTGRRWSDTPPDVKPNWSGVPGKVIPVLRQALAWRPENRWPDAQTFRRALWSTRTYRYRRYKWYATAVAATTLVLGMILGRVALSPRAPSYELAILPFVAGPGVDTEVAEKLTTLTGYHLDGFLTLAPTNFDVWLRANGIALDSVGEEELRGFGAHSVAYGMVRREEESFSVDIRTIDLSGEWIDAGTTTLDTSDLGQAAYGVGMYIAGEVDPNRVRDYAGSQALEDHNNAAIRAFVDGELAFARNEWTTAVEHYRTASRLDSTFALARWRLWNAWRWELTGEQSPAEVNLERLHDEESDRLPHRDSLILAAVLAPTTTERYEIYRSAIDEYPEHADVTHAFAEELFNRGPFTGIPLDSAAVCLRGAVGKDSLFSPTVLSLIWASIRLGHKDDAQRWLLWFEEITSSVEAGGDLFGLIQFAFSERFPTGQEPAQSLEDIMSPERLTALAGWFRVAPTFGIPQTQVSIGQAIAADPRRAAMAHEGQALGLFALGRLDAAFAHFDTAATLFATSSARLEAAEWRVISSALGLPGVRARSVDQAAETLESMTEDSLFGARAAWALGISAALTGEASAAGGWLEHVRTGRPENTAHRLSVLLNAVIEGETGRRDSALSLSETALAWDSAGLGGDPFASTVLHLRRAAWLDELGNYESADAARLWYEHINLVANPTGEALPAEIDWAFGSYAMWLRGQAAFAHGDNQAACIHLVRVAELWADSDEEFLTIRDSAATTASTLGCQ